MIYNVAIIGAGLSGALLSYELSQKNISHIIIDKGRGLGGRFSSRRMGQTYFNHGAQNFPFNEFEKEIWFQNWIKTSMIKRRKSNWSIESKASDLVRSLISEKNIHLNEEILEIRDKHDSLEMRSKTEKIYSAKKVIVTAPLPQAAKLAGEWIAPAIRDKMLNTPFIKKIIFFVSNKKLLRFATANEFTIESKMNDHMFVFSDEISAENFENSDSEIVTSLMRFLQSYVDELQPEDIIIKRWRYAQPMNSLSENYYQSLNKKIYFAGDGFAGEKLFAIEKVFQSTRALLTASDLLS